MITLEDSTSLALLYHLNSEPWMNTEAYQAGGSVEYLTLEHSGPALPLPPPGESAITKLVRARYSCRKFQPQQMPLATLSMLVWAANGLTRQGELPDGNLWMSRTVPSAGGLYPLEVYALVQRVEGLAAGVYHYSVWHHSLEPLGSPMGFRDFEHAVLAFPFIEDANVMLFLVAVFERTQRKYGPRGYRYILLEAGHAAQNVCLAATESALASLCIGGYLDTKLNTLLQLQDSKEGVVYALGVGYPRVVT
jgi:SagB-type dehydrogenase family enzyme